MTEFEYYDWFGSAGYRRTGKGTLLTEEWIDQYGQTIMVPRPSELSEQDREAAIERARTYLGIDYPKGPRVH